jgi:hypothetical protein
MQAVVKELGICVMEVMAVAALSSVVKGDNRVRSHVLVVLMLREKKGGAAADFCSSSRCCCKIGKRREAICG